jgi:hypothetical protein
MIAESRQIPEKEGFETGLRFDRSNFARARFGIASPTSEFNEDFRDRRIVFLPLRTIGFRPLDR